MKSKKTLMLLIAIPLAVMVAAIIVLMIFLGKPDNQDPGNGIVPVLMVDASNPQGFYEKPFNLVLASTSDGLTIRYTLDGSTPVKDSVKYETPIPINGPSKEGDPAAVTIIRAATFKSDVMEGDISTYTYIICPKDRYKIPVISIVTDNKNLYDESSGIFSKAASKGKDWEKPVHIEMFESDGSLKLNQEAGLRVYGGILKDQTPKSLRLYARKEYFSDGKFSYPIFPDYRGLMANQTFVGSYNSFILRNPADDQGASMLRDALIQRLSRPLGLDYQEYRPAAVYLNGAYYGLLNITEDMNEDYIQSHYGVPRENIGIINTTIGSDGTAAYGIDTGTSSDLQSYQSMMDFIINNNMTDASKYNQASDLLDIDNFISYMVTQIYSGNTEWPNNNVKAWRNNGADANINAPQGFDGKWRYVLKNTDSGFGLNSSWDKDSLDAALKSNNLKMADMLKSLLNNKEFKAKLVQGVCDVINEAAKPDEAVKLLNQMKATIETEVGYSFAKYKLGEVSKWQNSINTITEFAQKRPAAMLGFVENGLSNVGATLDASLSKENMATLTVNKPINGSIIINTVKLFSSAISSSPDSWSGRYFKNIPFDITVTPQDGYELKNFDISGQIQTVNGKYFISGDASITPIFVKKSDAQVKDLVINEVLSNTKDKKIFDWVEIYNAGASAINLKGYYLSDDLTFLAKWQIPDATIQPGQYLIIYCSTLDATAPVGEIHTNFSLSDNETVSLTKPDGSTVVDSVNVGFSDKAVSIGRYPNGTGNFTTLNEATKGKENIYKPYYFYK